MKCDFCKYNSRGEPLSLAEIYYRLKHCHSSEVQATPTDGIYFCSGFSPEREWWQLEGSENDGKGRETGRHL